MILSLELFRFFAVAGLGLPVRLLHSGWSFVWLFLPVLPPGGALVRSPPPELGILRLHQMRGVETGGGSGTEMKLLDRVVVAGDRL